MFRRYVLLVLVWLAVVGLSAIGYVACMLRFGTFTEWYAETVSYQLLGFGVTLFPLLLLALPVAVVVCHRRWSRSIA
jgi:hypothetical protein